MNQQILRRVCGQVRESYLEFMVSMARIAREDRNLTQDEERVWEDMTQVLELETDIANVSLTGDGKTQQPKKNTLEVGQCLKCVLVL